jgi:hypothetical protein
MRWMVVLAVWVLIGSVTAEAQPASKPVSAVPNPDPLPRNYRAQIVENVKTRYVEPTGIREASIAKPFYGSPRLNFHGGPLAYVCVRANAQIRAGLYSGLKTTAYLFHGGKIVDTHVDKMGLIICRAPVPYHPFPELMAVRKAPPG